MILTAALTALAFAAVLLLGLPRDVEREEDDDGE